jgi:hypothetical protein
VTTTASSTTGVQAWFGRAVFGLDAWLRRSQGVFEYASDPDCIFRLELMQLQHAVELTDGTTFSKGDDIAQLHLWNEQVPTFPAAGATLQWASHMNRCLDRSLRQFCSFLDKRSDLRSIKAVRVKMAIGSARQRTQLLRIFGRYGFRPVREDESSRTTLSRLHREAENVLVALLTLAGNPRAFRISRLRRSRADLFVPLATLDTRYRSAGCRQR